MLLEVSQSRVRRGNMLSEVRRNLPCPSTGMGVGRTVSVGLTRGGHARRRGWYRTDGIRGYRTVSVGVGRYQWVYDGISEIDSWRSRPAAR
eukprot:6680778-Pyramimonas_sp.AAC.1